MRTIGNKVRTLGARVAIARGIDSSARFPQRNSASAEQTPATHAHHAPQPTRPLHPFQMPGSGACSRRRGNRLPARKVRTTHDGEQFHHQARPADTFPPGNVLTGRASWLLSQVCAARACWAPHASTALLGAAAAQMELMHAGGCACWLTRLPGACYPAMRERSV